MNVVIPFELEKSPFRCIRYGDMQLQPLEIISFLRSERNERIFSQSVSE